jgi:hypothetical protein
MPASSPISGSESPSTSRPAGVARKASKCKALIRWRQLIHELYGPPKKAVKLLVPKNLQGIREVRRKIWINDDILQVASSLTSTLKFHVAEVAFREAMHFPRATPEEDVPIAPMAMYKAERVDPNERIGSRPRKDASDFVMLYDCLFRDNWLRFPFSDFQVEILNRLEVAPSLLHPNAWGFINAFEIFCWANNWELSSNLFLYLFAPYHLCDFSFISFCQKKDHAFFTAYDVSFQPFKEAYFKVFYICEDYPFWTGPDGSPLFPIYWSYDHYLREAESYVTDHRSLLDSDLAIIVGLHDFNKNYGLVKCNDDVRSRSISPADTLGNVVSVFLLLLS